MKHLKAIRKSILKDAAVAALLLYFSFRGVNWKDFGAAIRINSRNRSALANRVSLFACMKMPDEEHQSIK